MRSRPAAARRGDLDPALEVRVDQRHFDQGLRLRDHHRSAGCGRDGGHAGVSVEPRWWSSQAFEPLQNQTFHGVLNLQRTHVQGIQLWGMALPYHAFRRTKLNSMEVFGKTA